MQRIDQVFDSHSAPISRIKVHDRVKVSDGVNFLGVWIHFFGDHNDILQSPLKVFLKFGKRTKINTNL